MKLLIALVVSFSAVSFAAPSREDVATLFGNLNQGTEFDAQLMETAFGLNGEENSLSHHGACGELELTDEQKDKIKDVMIATKKTLIQKKADLDIAKIDYFVAITDEDGEKAAASTAATTLSDNAGGVLRAYLKTANTVLFDILTVEQRRPAVACMIMVKKLMKKAMLKKACEKISKDAHDKKKHP